ncbi:acyl-CoA thioesterase [Paenibacillus abyssi]|uniref:Acyl-CoA thioester hydrolase n=1 Tax=Paenibacillus abyssi TaxID=1340531 RepID=A0A917LGC7_9BACL|nr:thioesterase family protein [Paenibacillus abyssi]GGG20911.1 acyl-CoA thioester hydrolase [Paenibacillus abyssi]
MASHWYLHLLRVRYQETDQMAVVFHGNYVNWFEIGRTELIRQAGFPYKDIERSGLLLPVTELDCRFLQPARYDDRIVICTRIVSYSTIRLAFESEIRKVAEHVPIPERCADGELPGELLVKGGTRHVWIGKDWRPARVDKIAPELYALIQKTIEINGMRGDSSS